MHKVNLGGAIAMSPICYKNFIAHYKQQIGTPVHRTRVNVVLAESQANAVLRRTRLKTPRSVFNATRMSTEQTTRGDWYLEFKNKRDYTAFVLKWG
jgi:hypothetical protein